MIALDHNDEKALRGFHLKQITHNWIVFGFGLKMGLLGYQARLKIKASSFWIAYKVYNSRAVLNSVKQVINDFNNHVQKYYLIIIINNEYLDRAS